MSTSIGRRAAVQFVTFASSTLSAAYYFQQAPDLKVLVHDHVAINPFAIGLALTAFALDTVKPEMARIAGDSASGAVRRGAAGLVFAILFVASMLAVDGFLVKLRSDWAATRGHAVSAYADARTAVTSLETEFGKVASARTTQQVRTAMERASVHARTFNDTRQCTKLTDDDDRRLCRPILDLREEMAAAIRKADIEIKLTDARVKLGQLNAPKSADPQADALATWSGAKVDVVAYVMVAILGFAVEVVACLGVWIVQRPTNRSDANGEAVGETANRSPNRSTASEIRLLPTPAPNGSPFGGQPLPRRNRQRGELKPFAPNGSEASANIERFVTTEVALGRTIASQRDIAQRFGCAASTVSEALRVLEQRGVIQRRMDGRCKITEARSQPRQEKRAVSTGRQSCRPHPAAVSGGERPIV
jgi:ribosomal protein S25